VPPLLHVRRAATRPAIAARTQPRRLLVARIVERTTGYEGAARIAGDPAKTLVGRWRRQSTWWVPASGGGNIQVRILHSNLRLIYHAPNRARAVQVLYRWLTYCADADIPEFTRLTPPSPPDGSSCLPTSTPSACRTAHRSDQPRDQGSQACIG